MSVSPVHWYTGTLVHWYIQHFLFILLGSFFTKRKVVGSNQDQAVLDKSFDFMGKSLHNNLLAVNFAFKICNAVLHKMSL